MFETFKANRAAAKVEREQRAAAKAVQVAAASWQQEHDNLSSLLASAQSEGSAPDGLALHRGESCFGTLTSCSLVEERRGQGHYVGGNAGVSIPIGKIGGRSIRYRVGATRGHYTQGTPSPTAIATGTLYITNQRFVFLSTTQTRECRFDHVVGIQRNDDDGSMTISISNRQHPVVFSYGSSVASWVDFHVELGMSHYRGDTADLVTQLQQELSALEAKKPAAS